MPSANRRAGALVAVALLAAACLTAAGQTVGRTGTTPYDKLLGRDSELALELRELGMTELLESLIGARGETTRGMNSLVMLADLKVAQAKSGRVTSKQADQLYAKATNLLERAVSEAENNRKAADAKDEDIIKSFKLKAKLAMLIGLDRCEPFVLRLRYLQGSKADRESTKALTNRAVELLDELNRHIPRQIETWQADLWRVPVQVRELKRLRDEVAYKAAWVFYYRGMAMGKGESGGKTMLREAMEAVRKYQDDPDSGVMHWSRLLLGMAHRELGEHGDAGKYLRKAQDSQAGPTIRMMAMFEECRNLTESRKFPEGEKAIEKFRKESLKMLGKAGELQIDLKTCLLKNYLYETWAAVTKDKKKRSELKAKAMGAFEDFVKKYPDPRVQNALKEIVGPKLRGLTEEDYPKTSSFFLYLLAKSAMDAEDYGRADRLLKMIIGRTDAPSKKRHPLSLWHLGLICNKLKQNDRAAKYFLRLAKEYPNHNLAYKASRNAVISYNGVIEERLRDGKVISNEMRASYIEALEIMLRGKWTKSSTIARQVSEWYYNLGQQYHALSDRTPDEAKHIELVKKAIAAYAKVPPQFYGEHVHAGYLALALRLDVFEKEDIPDTVKRHQTATALKDDLLAYAGKAHADSPKKRATNQKLSKDLLRWGSNADLRAAIILFEMPTKDPARKAAEEDEALAIIAKLPAKWPGTDVAKQGKKLLIDMFLRLARAPEAKGEKYVAKAIDELLNYMETHSGKETMELVGDAAGLLERQIRRLRGKPDKLRELKSFQRAYYKFAGALYAPVKDQPIAKRHEQTRTMGGAALEADHLEEALKLFGECQAYEARRHNAQRERLKRDFGNIFERLRAKEPDTDRAVKLARDYLRKFKEHGFDEKYAMHPDAVRRVLEWHAEAKTGADERKRLKELARVTDDAHKDLFDRLKRRIVLDEKILFGLARCHKGLKRYEGALKYYDLLMHAINPGKLPKLYWNATAEFLWCVRQAYGAEPETMAALVRRIDGLAKTDKLFGGHRNRIMRIRAEAEKVAKEAATRPASAPATGPASSLPSGPASGPAAATKPAA